MYDPTSNGRNAYSKNIILATTSGAHVEQHLFRSFADEELQHSLAIRIEYASALPEVRE